MRINIECHYVVELSNIEIGEMGVTKEIMESLEYLSTLPDLNCTTIHSDEKTYAGLDWINDHISEQDAYDFEYYINDFDKEVLVEYGRFSLAKTDGIVARLMPVYVDGNILISADSGAGVSITSSIICKALISSLSKIAQTIFDILSKLGNPTKVLTVEISIISLSS